MQNNSLILNFQMLCLYLFLETINPLMLIPFVKIKPYSRKLNFFSKKNYPERPNPPYMKTPKSFLSFPEHIT